VKAHRGEIPEFTGVSARYEAPERADVALDTAAEDLASCVARLLELALPGNEVQEKTRAEPTRDPIPNAREGQTHGGHSA
jgi:Adenylylsulphate kinase